MGIGDNELFRTWDWKEVIINKAIEEEWQQDSILLITEMVEQYYNNVKHIVSTFNLEDELTDFDIVNVIDWCWNSYRRTTFTNKQIRETVEDYIGQFNIQ